MAQFIIVNYYCISECVNNVFFSAVAQSKKLLPLNISHHSNRQTLTLFAVRVLHFRFYISLETYNLLNLSKPDSLQSNISNTSIIKHAWAAEHKKTKTHCSWVEKFNGQRLRVLSWWRCIKRSGNTKKRRCTHTCLTHNPSLTRQYERNNNARMFCSLHVA